eukprot:4414502-Amphidinium_carterae.2
MQFRLVYRLPAARQGIGELGRLSRDATAALTMRRFSRVFTTAIREKQGIRGRTCRHFLGRGQFLQKLNSKAKGLHTGRNFLQEIPNPSFFALALEERALEDNVVRSTNARLTESACGIFIENPGTTVVHP